MEADGGSGKGAAFFDLDKTLMAGSSGMVFARVANRKGFVPRGQLARWGFDHLRYRLRGSSDEQTNAVLEVAKRVFADLPERDIERMGPEVLAGILPRIYPQMLDEIHRHQDEGRATFIVSAAGNDLVKTLAAVLGMEGGIGTRWAVGSDGRYTGEMDGPFVYGKGKVEAMRRFAEEARHRPRRVLGVLRLGQRPADAALGGARRRRQPGRTLVEIARQEGWQVMRFEKIGRKLAIAGATRSRPRRAASARCLEAPEQRRPAPHAEPLRR